MNKVVAKGDDHSNALLTYTREVALALKKNGGLEPVSDVTIPPCDECGNMRQHAKLVEICACGGGFKHRKHLRGYLIKYMGFGLVSNQQPSLYPKGHYLNQMLLLANASQRQKS